MFLKNHAKSKVFQKNKRPQAFFVKILCQVGKLGYNSHGWTQSFRSFDQGLTSPSGVQRRIYTTSAEHEFLYLEKCAQQLPYGFNSLDKFEGCPNENQIPYRDMDF